MFARFLIILVFLSLLDQLSSLLVGAELQKMILKRLELKEPPVVVSNQATACIDYLKNLENADNEYNEIDCFDHICKFHNYFFNSF